MRVKGDARAPPPKKTLILFSKLGAPQLIRFCHSLPCRECPGGRAAPPASGCASVLPPVFSFVFPPHQPPPLERSLPPSFPPSERERPSVREGAARPPSESAVFDLAPPGAFLCGFRVECSAPPFVPPPPPQSLFSTPPATPHIAVERGAKLACVCLCVFGGVWVWVWRLDCPPPLPPPPVPAAHHARHPILSKNVGTN